MSRGRQAKADSVVWAKMASGSDTLSGEVLRIPRRRSSSVAIALNELLAAVDIVGRARQCCVTHEVYGQLGYIDWFDDTPDRECRAELVTAFFEISAKNRGRERCVDETCCDQIDAGWRELEGEVGEEWWERYSRRGGDAETNSWSACSCTAYECQGACGCTFAAAHRATLSASNRCADSPSSISSRGISRREP